MKNLTKEKLLNKLEKNEIVIYLNLETIKMKAAQEGRIKIEYLPSGHIEVIELDEAVRIYNKYAN